MKLSLREDRDNVMICISLTEEVERSVERYAKFCGLPSVIIYDFIIEENLYELWGKFVEKIKDVEQISPKVVILSNENLSGGSKTKAKVHKIPQNLHKIRELAKKCEDVKEEILTNYLAERLIKPTHHHGGLKSEFLHWFVGFKGAFKLKNKTLNSYYKNNYFKELEKICLIDEKLKGNSGYFKNIIESIHKIQQQKAKIEEIEELERSLEQISERRELWRNLIYS